MAKTTAPATASSGATVARRGGGGGGGRRGGRWVGGGGGTGWRSSVAPGWSRSWRKVAGERRGGLRRSPAAGSVRRGEVREGGAERLVVRVHAVAGRDHEVGEQGELGVDDVVTELAA